MVTEVQVLVRLKGEMAKKFEAIKERLGVNNNTEVVRILLNKEFSEINPNKKEA